MTKDELGTVYRTVESDVLRILQMAFYLSQAEAHDILHNMLVRLLEHAEKYVRYTHAIERTVTDSNDLPMSDAPNIASSTELLKQP